MAAFLRLRLRSGLGLLRRRRVGADAGVDPPLEIGPLEELEDHERRALVVALADFPLPVDGNEGYRTAEVTGGGVPLGEVSPRTLESRITPGLHFAGEILEQARPPDRVAHDLIVGRRRLRSLPAAATAMEKAIMTISNQTGAWTSWTSGVMAGARKALNLLAPSMMGKPTRPPTTDSPARVIRGMVIRDGDSWGCTW